MKQRTDVTVAVTVKGQPMELTLAELMTLVSDAYADLEERQDPENDEGELIPEAVAHLQDAELAIEKAMLSIEAAQDEGLI